jgi:prepilin-type N-terminal cleavage/methylation domain-containing protein
MFPTTTRLNRASHRCGAVTAPAAFTLIELLVAVVIISILSSLSLAGLAITRQRSKADKTRSTIRKLHEIVVPNYEGFLRRRVPLPASGAAIPLERLNRIRTLTMYELPDSLADIAMTPSASTLESGDTIPSYAWTAVARSYSAYRQSRAATLTTQHRSAECLFAIVSRGQREPDVMAQFRNDEIGDTDTDNAHEFLDGWGRPISFMRWPTGFVTPNSLIQVDDPVNRHDPFDPSRREADAFALTPLVYSAGPDGEDGIVQLESWTGRSLPSLFSQTNTATPPQRPGSPTTGVTTSRDNVTNHDLNTR